MDNLYHERDQVAILTEYKDSPLMNLLRDQLTKIAHLSTRESVDKLLSRDVEGAKQSATVVATVEDILDWLTPREGDWDG